MLFLIHPEFGEADIIDSGELVYRPWELNESFDDEFFAIVSEGDNSFRVWSGTFNPVASSVVFEPTATYWVDSHGNAVNSTGYSLGPVKGFLKWLIKKLTKNKPKARRTDHNRVDEWFHREQDRRRRNGQDAIDSDVAPGVIVGAAAGEIIKDSIPVYGDLREVPTFLDECRGLVQDVRNYLDSCDHLREAEEEHRENEQPEIEERRNEWLEYLERMRELDPNRRLG